MAGLTPEIGFRTATTLSAEHEQAERERLEQEERAAEALRSGLSDHIENAFRRAKEHRATYVLPDLEDCRRRRDAKYTPEKLAELRRIGGCDLYFDLTDPRISALDAALEEVYTESTSVEDMAWALAPTPVPELPDDVLDQIKTRLATEFLARMQEATQQLQGVDQAAALQSLKQQLADRALDLYDEHQAKIFAEAKRRAQRLGAYVQDQLLEGEFYDALHDCFLDLATFPACFIKGPVIEAKPKPKWVGDQYVTEDALVPTYRCVSPFDIFPSPHSRKLGDDSVCELVHLDVDTLRSFRDAPGWLSEQIDLAIADWKSGSVSDPLLAGESERALSEKRTPTAPTAETSTLITAIEFWGRVSGQDLLDWAEGNDVVLADHGLPRDIEEQPSGNPASTEVDANEWYAITALLVGRRIVHLRRNWHPTGQLPYGCTSYRKRNNSIWGKSPVQSTAAYQDAFNACLRNAMNNAAASSMPVTAYDINQFEEPPQLQPGAAYGFDATQSNGRDAIIKIETPNGMASFLNGARYFADQADDASSISRLQYGSPTGGAAAGTATGIQAIQGNAGRNTMRVVRYVGRDLVQAMIKRQVIWNNLFVDDPELKGDVTVVISGAQAVLQRRDLEARRVEWLAALNNPRDAEIIGMEGRAKLIRATCKQFALDPGEIVPPDHVLRDRARQALEAQKMAVLPGMPQAPVAQGQPPEAEEEGGEQ